MTITIRPALLEELPALSQLCLRSKAVWGYDQAFLDACRSELTLQPGDLTSSRVAVAETDGAVVGVVQIGRVDPDAELHRLFIEPNRIRGGIGRILFQWAVEQTRAMGATRMTIEADPGAAPFYRRLGACDVGTAPSGSIPGRVLPKLAFLLYARCAGQATPEINPGVTDW